MTRKTPHFTRSRAFAVLAVTFVTPALFIAQITRTDEEAIVPNQETVEVAEDVVPPDVEVIEPGLPVAAPVRLPVPVSVPVLVAPPEEAPVKELVDIPVDEPTVAVRTGAPVRLTIPSITVDAVIEQVTLTPDGSMDVPKLPLNVAWYALGPRPGEVGSATMTGHVDWVNGRSAVFANLHKVQPGDKIAVEDDRGEIAYFLVTETRRFAASEDATDIFVSNDEKAHLNIITCIGKWDKLEKQYAERLVVFADEIE